MQLVKRVRAIGIVPIIEVAPRIDVLTQVFCVRTFSMGRKELWKSNDGDAWLSYIESDMNITKFE